MAQNRHGFRNFITHPLWQFLAALATILALLFAIFAWFIPNYNSLFPHSVSASPTPSNPVGAGTTTPTNTGNGGSSPPYIFTGKGNMDTRVFNVGKAWDMVITCTSQTTMEPGAFRIDVIISSSTDNSGTLATPIDVETCTGNNGGSETAHEGQSGAFYLHITARDDIAWTIQIPG